MLRLQHAPEKDRAYRAFAPIEWSEDLRSWCVFDSKFIVEILKSPDFVVVDYAAEYRKLDQRTGIGWTDLVHVLSNIPLAAEGSRHAELRREFARLIHARGTVTKAAVSQTLKHLIPLVFRAGAKADLVADLVRPLNDVFFSELIGAPIPSLAPAKASPSQIFDRFLSLNRRKKLRDEVARVSKCLAEAELATTANYATAFLAVGHDSVLGTLGSSLVAVLQHKGDTRLCDLDYPRSLPRTGVPYIERFATKPFVFANVDVEPGDRLRLFLDACPARDSNGEQAVFFGKGRHVCLGKEPSEWLWRAVTEELAKIPLRVRLIEARLRRNDFVFSVYESIKVSIHE